MAKLLAALAILPLKKIKNRNKKKKSIKKQGSIIGNTKEEMHILFITMIKGFKKMLNYIL